MAAQEYRRQPEKASRTANGMWGGSLGTSKLRGTVQRGSHWE